MILKKSVFLLFIFSYIIVNANENINNNLVKYYGISCKKIIDQNNADLLLKKNKRNFIVDNKICVQLKLEDLNAIGIKLSQQK